MYVCVYHMQHFLIQFLTFFQLVISFQVTQNDITIDIIKPESFPFCTSIICSLYLRIGSPLFECRHIAVYVCINFKIYIPTPTLTHAKAPTFFFSTPISNVFSSRRCRNQNETFIDRVLIASHCTYVHDIFKSVLAQYKTHSDSVHLSCTFFDKIRIMFDVWLYCTMYLQLLLFK